jgi:hypothetical protein
MANGLPKAVVQSFFTSEPSISNNMSDFEQPIKFHRPIAIPDGLQLDMVVFLSSSHLI